MFKESEQIGLRKPLKKIHVHDQGWKKDQGFRSSTVHFINFLKSQKNSIEELTVDWFLHRNTEDQLSIKIVSTAFENFKKIKKLTIADNLECLRSSSTKIDEMNLVENPNVTELYLRCDNKKLAKKLIEASPNLNKLFVRYLDQELMEFCAQKLIRVNSICALVVQFDTLSNATVQFKHLQRINFISCSVKNHPEIQQMHLNEAKSTILSMITNK
jgi:precorrin-6B methylase 2